MKAVFEGKIDIVAEDRRSPTIQSLTDIVVKARYTALFGRYDTAPEFHFLVVTYPSCITANFMCSVVTAF
jgi:hypothetical protein